MVILVDTREQLPYWPGNRTTLVVGDYTTKKLFNKFHIERKSLSDLYGTLTSGNRRFKYELFRAAYYGIHLEVYVEGSRLDFINKKFPKGNERKFSTDGLDRLIKTFEAKYFLTFHWAKNRPEAILLVMGRLKAEEAGKSTIIRKKPKTAKNRPKIT
jgi:ERCC4-type nuclease